MEGMNRALRMGVNRLYIRRLSVHAFGLSRLDAWFFFRVCFSILKMGKDDGQAWGRYIDLLYSITSKRKKTNR